MTLSRFASPLEKQGIVGGGAVFTFPSANADAIREVIMVDFVVEYESPKTRRRVDKKLLELLDPYYIFAGIWESHSAYSMIIPSVPIQERFWRP
jgi:hypothetical protein